MKVLPCIQFDAILYFLRVKLRTDPILLDFTEKGNPDEIVLGNASYFPLVEVMDKKGERVIASSVDLPALVIEPKRVEDYPHGLGLRNYYVCDLYYIVQVPEDEVYDNRVISGPEKSYRLLMTVWRRLAEYLYNPYIGDRESPAFKLSTHGKVMNIDFSKASFAIMDGSVSYLQAELTFDTIASPYDVPAPAILSSIYSELQQGSAVDMDEGPTVSGEAVLDYE
jgi:hypothetical protein